MQFVSVLIGHLEGKLGCFFKCTLRNMFPERWKVTDLHLAGGAENVNSEMSFILWQLVAVL